MFREGALVQAVRHGHWIVLDELNLAPTEVLEALNRLLDDNRELFVPELQASCDSTYLLITMKSVLWLFVFSRGFGRKCLHLYIVSSSTAWSGELTPVLPFLPLQTVVTPHPHFMLFATQNPPGAYAGA